MLAPPLVELRDVWKSFEANHVLRGISLELHRGTTLAVMGGSGAGKTVLLRIIAGLVRPDSGEVSLFGTRIANLAPDAPILELAPQKCHIVRRRTETNALYFDRICHCC